MKTKSFAIFAVSICLGAAACGPSDRADVERRVQLEPELSVPMGQASAENDDLHVAVTGLEELESGVHVVWLDSGGEAPLRAGVLEDGVLEAEIDGLESGWRCFVTEEGATEPDAPSSSVRLDGTAGGDLFFDQAFTIAQLSGAAGSCTLSDRDVDLSLEGLPEPPDGLNYAAWAVCPHFADEHHDDEPHEDDSHHQDEASEPEELDHPHGLDDDVDGAELVRLGELEHNGLHRRHSKRVGGCESVFVTLESSRGVEAPSPIRVMHGDVEYPQTDEHEVHMH